MNPWTEEDEAKLRAAEVQAKLRADELEALVKRKRACEERALQPLLKLIQNTYVNQNYTVNVARKMSEKADEFIRELAPFAKQSGHNTAALRLIENAQKEMVVLDQLTQGFGGRALINARNAVFTYLDRLKGALK